MNVVGIANSKIEKLYFVMSVLKVIKLEKSFGLWTKLMTFRIKAHDEFDIEYNENASGYAIMCVGV